MLLSSLCLLLIHCLAQNLVQGLACGKVPSSVWLRLLMLAHGLIRHCIQRLTEIVCRLFDVAWFVLTGRLTQKAAGVFRVWI